MNQYLALLELKKIITPEEALALAQYLANAPQSTRYSDALYDIGKVLETAQEQ